MSDAPDSPRPAAADHGPGGIVFWLMAGLGGGILTFGALGLIRNVQGPQLLSFAEYFFGALILHDGFLMPFVAVASFMLVRLLPAYLRPPLQGAIVVSGVTTLVAIPLLTGYGRLPNNPSFLPDKNYWTNLLIVLAVVWAVAIGLTAARAARHRAASADAASREGAGADAHHDG